MLRIESDPVLRSPILVVGLLDRAPTHDAVECQLAAAAVAIPRLRQRIDRGLLGAWHWVDDAQFSCTHHLRSVRVAPHGTLREVLDIVGPVATAPFDDARPPWELTLVEGLSAGRAAFVLRFHHALTDGVGGIDLARSFFEIADPESSEVTRTSAPRSDNAHETRPSTLRAVSGLGASVGRMLAPARAPLSPVLIGRSLDRRLDALDASFASMQSAARELDVTVNEAFLTAVAGALYDYHVRSGKPVPALRFTMPISIRGATDAPGGNRFVPARFVMPIDEPDVKLRARLVAAAVRGQRREPAIKIADVLADGLALLPTPALTRTFAGMLRNVDVDVVDVPGLERPAYLAGAHVTDMWAFAPPTGAALSVTLLSHGAKCCFGILSDTAAVSDPALLTTCFEHALAEVLAHAEAADEELLP